MKPRSHCRPFTTADAMALVAALAVALGIIKDQWQADIQNGWRSARPIYATALAAARLTGPFLATWTIAFAVIRLREPHPPWRRLRNQPGTVACLGVAGVAAFLLPYAAVRFLIRPSDSYRLIDFFWQCQMSIAPAVIGAWVTLRLGGRWRAEPGWIDPLGMVIGGGWIAIFGILLAMVAILSG